MKTYKQLLNKSNLKATKQRLNVIAVVADSKKPISVGQLLERCESVGHSSFFRIVNELCEKDIFLRSVSESGSFLYSMKHAHEHTLHCTVCENDFATHDCPFEPVKYQFEEKTGFSITAHQLKLEGICADCKNTLSEHR